MICSLCNLEKNPKSNTHYLTDYIIRTALNEDGVNLRDKGLYFNIDPDSLFKEMKFQRATLPEKLEEILGRQTTEEENLRAQKSVEFSVDNKFCKECEDKFGIIEVSFNDNILKYYRNQQFNEEQDLIQFDVIESKIVRLFFLMQFWRTSICDDSFTLSEEVTEFLRTKILNIDYEGLEVIPLSVTYLETLKDDDDEDEGDAYKTENSVAIVSGSNPYIILMNDFVIQLYDEFHFEYTSFYGLNNKDSYLTYLYFNQPEFASPVLTNLERKQFNYNLMRIAALNQIESCRIFFRTNFKNKFNVLPDVIIEAQYLDKLKNSNDITIFSEENLTRFTDVFISEL